ncbi:transporter [Chryseosolibacter indicus]|uniref:Transporter n=1 Tax=Chryseosolibacter indicus TaxID=2782351 RepID=A0ABS5VLM3_9BACT|nr:transporter [Chryseosolibacter indicus]MBT1702011.1 hypothetical protein [Chryseosolibacter indicus]
MKLLYVFAMCIALSFASLHASAQGCVAVKNMSSCSLEYDSMPKRGWQFSLNYRYFRSFRHFKGKEEQKERLEKHTEVINNDNSIIAGISYRYNKNFSFAAAIPYIYIDRSSLYEHDRVHRYHSQSSGIGDIRLTGYYGLNFSHSSNLTFGLGLKLPTGDYNTKDYFHTVDGPQLRPVDQSIQPGDGGLGIITELNYSKMLGRSFNVYLNSMYMFNPRNTNGTRTFRETLNPLYANEAIMSVVDQYFARIGGHYVFNEMLSAGVAGRVEGIPVEDLIGDSDGFRRPGYILSVEPNLLLTHKTHSFAVNFPIALIRNRTQSLTDKQTQAITGQPRHGDAAFADWLLSVTYAYKFTR